MPPIKNENRFPLFYVIVLLSIVILIQVIFFRGKIEEISYGEFKKLAEQPYRIEKCIVSTTHIRGVYIKDEKVYQEVLEKKKQQKQQADPVKEREKKELWFSWLKGTKGTVSFSTVRVHDDPQLVKILQEKNVPFKGEAESFWGAVFLTWGLPIILIVVFFMILMRRMNNYGRDVMSFGKSRAKITAEENTKITFNEVAGCDEAKEELTEIVEFLKSPKKFENLGGKIPKGALLVGPPGTGKTLLAKAVAGEAGVPFFNISGSEFVEMFVGVGASRVRDLFHQAKSKNPCIIFIDEIDAVGRHRGAGLGGGHDEREQTLNQLLAEMDGFETNKGIIILAATNRPDILDPALLRPGRFDRQIVIDHPDIKGREEILKIHSKGKPLGQDVDLKLLAQRTPGFSGADLANVMNEAALLAARRDKEEINQIEIAEAVERVMAGPERKSRLISPEERKVTAIHEAGHALVAALDVDFDNRVHKITIVPRGRALGYVMHLPEKDKYNVTKEELTSKICVCLAGRVAEEICINRVSTGAQNDFQQATNIARSMVARYGMSPMGPLAYEKDDGYVFLGKNERKSYFGGGTIDQIDREVKKIVLSCYERTTVLVYNHKEILLKIADILLEVESLEGSEFIEIIETLKNGENVDIASLVEKRELNHKNTEKASEKDKSKNKEKTKEKEKPKEKHKPDESSQEKKSEDSDE